MEVSAQRDEQENESGDAQINTRFDTLPRDMLMTIAGMNASNGVWFDLKVKVNQYRGSTEQGPLPKYGPLPEYGPCLSV